MKKGTLYGVGVGPGDPQLLTLKAVETIRACPVVACPRTQSGTVALDIVSAVVSLQDKTRVFLDYTMSRDAEKREQSYREMEGQLVCYLDQGQSVALLNLGDVSVYASFQYVAQRLRGRYPVVMIPGVPSFCAAAAALDISLTEMSRPLHLIPGRCAEMDLPGTQIYMKSGSQLPELLENLQRRDRLDKAMMVQNCGLANERIYREIPTTQVEDDYFSLVIVKE